MLMEKQNVTPFELVVKEFGKDFSSEKGALTLKASEVCQGKIDVGHFSKKHPDGWTIEGFVFGDGEKFWVNEFMATHPQHLRVFGDLCRFYHVVGWDERLFTTVISLCT